MLNKIVVQHQEFSGWVQSTANP